MKNVLRKLYAALPLKPQIFFVLQKSKVLPRRVYQHLHFKGLIEIPVGVAARFKVLHHGYQVENDLFWAGFGNGWEGTSLRLWVRLVREHQVILDIGSNTGIYALSAKAVNPSAQVIAFEPIERIFNRLSTNILLNGFDIVAVQAAASNATGTAQMLETGSSHLYSASLNRTMLAGHADVGETVVQVQRVDEFLTAKAKQGKILCKIDAERHEVEVLLGFGDVLRTKRPTLLVEILDREIGSAIEELVKDMGYKFFEVLEGDEVRPIEHLGAGERNYLICTSELARSVGIFDGTSHDAIRVQ